MTEQYRKTCDVCDRNMVSNSGTELVGVEITIAPETEENVKNYKEIYPELTLGRVYKVCWVCSLKKLGIQLTQI